MRCRFLLVLAIALGFPTFAVADPGISPADALFRQARKTVKSGDYALALAQFQASHRLDPAPGTLLNIADCEEHLGRLSAALRHTKDVLLSLGPGDDRVP